MTEEQIAYCYRFATIRIKQKYGWSISNEDMEDLKQYVLRIVAVKFERHYDPTRTTWKTYAVRLLECTLIDAWKWHYRQHQRLQTVPLDETHESIMDEREDCDVDRLIDKLFEDDQTAHDVAMLKWRGHNQKDICKTLRISKKKYLDALVRIHDAIRGKTSP